MATHSYTSHLVWQGSTAQGYRDYSRRHRAIAPPATSEIVLSADPHFRGDPALVNPEQLLVLAASSCQLLSFLAVATRAGIDVLDYEDDAVGFMSEAATPMRINRIQLSPTIRVGAGTDPDTVLRLVDQAHDECYIANSLTSEVVVDATVDVG
jgi:organic hydroperoxide reductase OsmC/OhrA